MQLHPQSINIELPCKPFALSGQKVLGLDLHLFFDPTEQLVCPDCGANAVIHAKARARRPLQSIPIAPYRRTFWHIANRRGWCGHCGFTFTESIPFQFKGRHVTLDLAKKICDDMDEPNANIRSTARRLGLSEDLVRRVYDEFLRHVLSLVPEPTGVKAIAIDEFSILKGHRYATLVVGLDNKRVLHTCEGRTEQSVAPFFSRYSNEFYDNLECVSMDQNHTYSKQFSEKLPHVSIVSDRFHMSQNYTKDVIDKVRLRVARTYKRQGDDEGYALFKRSKYRLFTSQRKDPSLAGSERELDGQLLLRKLLGMNEDINTVVLMFEQLRALYEIQDELVMRMQWIDWVSMAEQSGIAELENFARRKRKHTNQIVAHATHQISSGIIEGMMNKIKVIKRAAFGFRSFDHFFMRIQYAFLPQQLKQQVKRELWSNCSEFLINPLYHVKCG